jgi:hypothetical protein
VAEIVPEYFPYDKGAQLEAVQDNLISYPVNPAMDRHLAKLARRGPGRWELERLAQQSQTTDQREFSWGLRQAGGQTDKFNIGAWIECARIKSLKDYITTIRKIDTDVIVKSGSPARNRSITSPFPTDPIFNAEYVRWHLWYCNPDQPFNQFFDVLGPLGQFDRPQGTPVFQLNEWRDNRYNYGRPQNTTIPILPNYNVVLFAQIVIPYFPNSPSPYPNWKDAAPPNAYAVGDIVQYPDFSAVNYICTVAHNVGTTPPPPQAPGFWQLYTDEDLGIKVMGRLIASTQSEQTLAAQWQARRTFHV